MIAWDIILNIGAVGVVAMGGILALINAGDKVMKGKRAELDGAETKLINTLKSQVEALDRKVNEQYKVIDSMKEQVDSLMRENVTLNKVLQGRDVETIESIKRTKEILQISKQNSKNIEKLYKVIEKYLSSKS